MYYNLYYYTYILLYYIILLYFIIDTYCKKDDIFMLFYIIESIS